MASTSANVSNDAYWGYALQPPLNRPTTWWDPPIPVYVNDSTRLSRPFDE